MFALAVALSTVVSVASASAVTTGKNPASSATQSPGVVSVRTFHVGPAIVRGVERRMTPTDIKAAGLTQHGVLPNDPCWYVTYYYINWATVDLGTSEQWCGTNTITYAQPGNCFGATRLPTYNYFSCNSTKFQGDGPWETKTETTWQWCPAWIPWPVQQCAVTEASTLWGMFYAGGQWGISG